VVCCRGTRVGCRVRIKPGAVIGGTGFGYAPGEDGLERIPHAGRCLIEDDVDIGANSCIDRGSIDDTVIGAGTKIEGTIGLVDPARVLNDSNAGKKAKESLTAFSKNRQALIEMEEKELRRMEEDFVKQASVLSPAAKNEREQVFRRRMAEYQQKAAELNREVQEKQKDVLEAFRDKVEAVVAKVANRNGLRVVIDKGKGGPAIYGAEELDITTQVIEEFNKEYP